MTETIKNATKTTEKKAVATTPKKPVEKKEPKPKTDFKVIAETVEKAFKDDKSVDVVADTKLTTPKSNIEGDYKYIHFFKPGTEKNLFGCYIQTATTTKFAVSNKVVEYLDKSVTATPVTKTVKGKTSVVYHVVECKNEAIVETAKKIIPAYQQMVLSKEAKKAEKKVEKKPAEKKAEPKKATAKKAEPKKVANK